MNTICDKFDVDEPYGVCDVYEHRGDAGDLTIESYSDDYKVPNLHLFITVSRNLNLTGVAALSEVYEYRLFRGRVYR